MKQVLTGFLTAVLILAAALVPAYGADAGAFPGGKLEVGVRADYRDTAAALERHAPSSLPCGAARGRRPFPAVKTPPGWFSPCATPRTLPWGGTTRWVSCW